MRATRGARVLVGRCWEAGGAPAYWPWVQSLRAYVRDTEPRGAASAARRRGAATSPSSCPSCASSFPTCPQPAALESEGARFRLFDAVDRVPRTRAAARPLVLILDDLHAADEPSLLLLQFVARELADEPPARDRRLPRRRSHASASRSPRRWRSWLASRTTRQIALAGLSDADVADYIELATGSSRRRSSSAAIHHETEGNPLFVTEVVRLLDAEGRLGRRRRAA